MIMLWSWLNRANNLDGAFVGSRDTGPPALTDDSEIEANGDTVGSAAGSTEMYESDSGSRRDASKINVKSVAAVAATAAAAATNAATAATTAAAAATTAAAVATTAAAAATAAVANESNEDEVQRLSDDLRCALKCPICMELSIPISTCCKNGHGICENCAHTMSSMNPGEVTRCPICRSPPARQNTFLPFRLCRYQPLQLGQNGPLTTSITHHQHMVQEIQPPPPPTIRKLCEFISATKVACSFRPKGCPNIMFISLVVEHEVLCPYASHVRCMVAWCRWMGEYNQVYSHVSTQHQFSAYEVSVT